jgi:hypothetical protein
VKSSVKHQYQAKKDEKKKEKSNWTLDKVGL